MLHRVEVFKLIDGLSLQVEGIEYANGLKVQGINDSRFNGVNSTQV